MLEEELDLISTVRSILECIEKRKEMELAQMDAWSQPLDWLEDKSKLPDRLIMFGVRDYLLKRSLVKQK